MAPALAAGGAAAKFDLFKKKDNPAQAPSVLDDAAKQTPMRRKMAQSMGSLKANTSSAPASERPKPPTQPR